MQIYTAFDIQNNEMIEVRLFATYEDAERILVAESNTEAEHTEIAPATSLAHLIEQHNATGYIICEIREATIEK